MLKYVYKVIILMAFFMGAFYIFSRNIQEIHVDAGKSVTEMSDSSFPVLYIGTQDLIINPLHGYSSNIDTREVRESITALTQDKTFTVRLEETESNIKKLEYEVRSIRDNALLDNSSITAFDKEKGYRVAKITLDTTLDTSTEYGLKFTIITNSSKKIHYYTRIKYYESDFYLKEKLEFAETFQKNTFTKEQPKKITAYIEPNSSEDNSSFSRVTINSSYDTITWGNMKPEVVTEQIPTIKEINVETAAILYDYYVDADTATARERFHIKEFFRVRIHDGQFYLLYYLRTMETEFNPDLASISENEFKIGITNETNMQLVMNEDKNKLAFVRDGSLWYYDMTLNKLTTVFTFLEKEENYMHASYDQHNIRILKMDNNGNIRFIVYGYMNRGDYEGRVAILLYDYDVKQNRIEERVYIPLTTTYLKLKQDFGNFSYVNDKDIFYFSLDNVVYAYNIASRKCETLVDNISGDNFVMLEQSKCFAWMNDSDIQKSDNITILNLETEKQQTVKAADSDNVALLGTIDDYMIVGYVHSKDIKESKDGSVLTPYYELQILDADGKVVKDYKASKKYITAIDVEDTVVHLTRVKKSGNTFVPTSSDSIVNHIPEDASTARLSTRVTDLAMTEYYISMPLSFRMKKLPDKQLTKNVIITEDTTLRLQENIDTHNKYYIYAHGTITCAMNDPAAAIITANDQMGVVLDNNSRLIWERGGKFLSKSVSGITPAYVEAGVTSIGACICMLLQTNQITVLASQVSTNKSITRIIEKYVNTPVNLTGCTLDEVLYFVSSGHPVIAMKNSSDAVLITEYTETTVTYIDPTSMTIFKVSLSNAEDMFKDAGYVFVSYVD